MKKRWIFSLMLFLAVASGCAHAPESAREAAKPDAGLASTAVAGTPVLDVPEWFFDFGEVKEGTDYVHAFVVRNKGAGVLEIRKVQPG